MGARTTRQELTVRSGLWVPLFDELADPLVVVRLAADAEAAGWHGLFVWDQLRWDHPVTHVGDPWITLAAVATATESVRLGPMVTPFRADGRRSSPGRAQHWTYSAGAA